MFQILSELPDIKDEVAFVVYLGDCAVVFGHEDDVAEVLAAGFKACFAEGAGLANHLAAHKGLVAPFSDFHVGVHGEGAKVALRVYDRRQEVERLVLFELEELALFAVEGVVPVPAVLFLPLEGAGDDSFDIHLENCSFQNLITNQF